MKIIHTADWHLGKLLCGVSLQEDQAFIMNEFYKMLAKEKPQLILMAGDVYDRSYPPVEAVRLLNQVLEKILIELKIKMIVITGNHDHADRLDFGSSLMEKSGLYLRAKLEKEIQPVVLEDEFAVWKIYPIPYADPANVRMIYEDASIKTSADAMRTVLKPIVEAIGKEKEAAKNNGFQKETRYLALAHSFFISGLQNELPEESDSERALSIGGVDYIPAEVFDLFDYVALGHLHKPQKIGRETMRYSGSLLKYSFSEASHHKSLLLLDWDKELEISKITLTPKRDLRIVSGSLEEILERGRQDQNREDYIMARLNNQELLIDPMSDLKAVYPNALALEYEKKTEQLGGSGRAGHDFTQKDVWTLFEEFYEATTGETAQIENWIQRKKEGEIK